MLEAGDFDEAFGLAEGGLRFYPDDGRLWEMRGIALGCRREIREAMTSLETASTLVPLTISGQMVLAACYFRTGNLESAECIYEYLATRTDIPIKLLPDLARGLDQVGKPELALQACRVAVGRVPECDSAWFAMAFFMTKLDYPVEQVVEVVRRAFDLSPTHVLYRVDLALLLARCGRQEEAHRLLAVVDLSELLHIHCPPRLAGLLALFQQMNDESRAAACQSRLSGILGHGGANCHE
jgi:tetratricopeptide (TPR) repeat protein